MMRMLDALGARIQSPIRVTERRVFGAAVDLSEQAYRAGSITLTDVLDANRELLGGQDELDANRADAARAAVAVYRAFGGGWDAPAVQTAKR